MEILPGKGAAGLFFGMDEDHVVQKYGKPDFIENISEDFFGKTHVFFYFDKGLTFYFDEEDSYRLGCIEVDSYDFFLFGENIARISKNHLEKILLNNNITDLYEENDEHQEALVSDSLFISFYFEFDTLISVQIGVPTDEEDKPLWPENGIKG